MACSAGAGGRRLDWRRTAGYRFLCVSYRTALAWLFLDRSEKILKAWCRQGARVLLWIEKAEVL